MNKQELIDELKKLLAIPSEVQGHNYSLIRAIALAKQLGEPEKPKVPQFVADWYEEHKDDFEGGVYELCTQCYEDEDQLSDELYDWFVSSENKPIETLVKMKLFGYEVKKEKLYTAKLKSTGEYLHRDTYALEVHHSFADDYTVKRLKTYHFTKDTLLKYSAWENDFYSVIEVR